MRYKVGDKVRVRKDLVVGEEYGVFIFADNMARLKGKIVTIEEVFSSTYQIKEDAGKYAWVDEMFEPVITNWDKVKEELKLEDFINHSGICAAIHRVRGEDNCHSISRSCADCQKWLKQPYQEPSILDDVEKEYLRAVIKPFRDKVAYITLFEYDERKEFIRIKTKNEPEDMTFPNFKTGTMYKGMKQGRKYSLEDLDL